MDDRGDKQAMCCWFLASVFSAGSQKFGPTHIKRWINTVPPGFVRLPVVALIPTDGRHNWEQSSKGQLVVSRRLHPGNPPCTAVKRSFTLLQKPFHPSASLLAFPDIPCNRTYPPPLSVRFVFRRKLKFRCKVGPTSLWIKHKS